MFVKYDQFRIKNSSDTYKINKLLNYINIFGCTNDVMYALKVFCKIYYNITRYTKPHSILRHIFYTPNVIQIDFSNTRTLYKNNGWGNIIQLTVHIPLLSL
jgi:hypothetical protein